MNTLAYFGKYLFKAAKSVMGIGYLFVKVQPIWLNTWPPEVTREIYYFKSDRNKLVRWNMKNIVKCVRASVI
jgi:hypothetical protein